MNFSQESALNWQYPLGCSYCHTGKIKSFWESQTIGWKVDEISPRPLIYSPSCAPIHHKNNIGQVHLNARHLQCLLFVALTSWGEVKNHFQFISGYDELKAESVIHFFMLTGKFASLSVICSLLDCEALFLNLHCMQWAYRSHSVFLHLLYAVF